jgi:ADP-heptose:LPS heptosyltransferase
LYDGPFAIRAGKALKARGKDRKQGQMAKKLLIYRMGSLGDTAVALPVFHLLARVYRDAERRVVTNMPVNSDAAPIESVLGDSGLAQGYFSYPLGTRKPGQLLDLCRQIRAWGPDHAVFISARQGCAVYRDMMFLRACGVSRILGAPTTGDLQTHRRSSTEGLWESEASRLARCAARIGDIDLDNPANWSLAPTAAETAAVERRLADWPGAGSFATFSIGAKLEAKSWGDGNWTTLLKNLSASKPGMGLALIGGPNDILRSEVVAHGWRGPLINFCGRLTPRQSALVIERARFFMGHDSGPMHLAACMNTPAVCVFNNHAKPGVWFPHGRQHRIFYPGLSWSGGTPPIRRVAQGETGISGIPVTPVLEACRSMLRHDEHRPIAATR